MKHTELGKAYSKYVKGYAFLILDCRLLQESPLKQLDCIRSSSPNEVLYNYGRLKTQIDVVLKEIYPNMLFCCNYRIYRNALKMLYVDLAKLYKICHSCMVELTKDLKSLDLNALVEVKKMCMSFIECSKEIEEQVGAMAVQLKEPLSHTIYYFKV